MNIIITIFVVLRIVSNSISNVYQKLLTKQGFNSYFVNTITYFLLSLCCVPFVLRLSKTSFGDCEFLICCLLIGLLGAIGNGFLVRALSCGELSLLGPINSYKAIVGMILGAYVLKEFPTGFAFFGMFLILLGSYFLLGSTNEKFSFNIFKDKSIQYRFLALVFTSAEAVFIKKLIVLSDVFTTFVVWCLSGFIFSFIYLSIKKIRLKEQVAILDYCNVKFFVFILLCTGLMQYTTNYLFERMNVAYALSLFQLSSLLSVFLGYKIFKEGYFLKKMFGAIIMVIGATFIFIFR